MSERIALVTGGTKGLGRAISRNFVENGIRVFINFSSDEKAAESAINELNSISNLATLVKADVSDQDQVNTMVEKIVNQAERLDILINNAGIIMDNLLMLMPDSNWHRVIDVNLNGVYYCSKAVLRPMIEKRWGRIINIISPSALLGRAGQTNYSASKGGVLSFTKSLAREVARFGITVNAVSPGLIETELTKHMDENIRKEFLSMIPAGRFGTPEEVSRTISFLASDEAGYITGEYISVDGGLT